MNHVVVLSLFLSDSKTSDEDVSGYKLGAQRPGSPVLEQRVLWDLVVGHWLPEGVDLLKNELSDL